MSAELTLSTAARNAAADAVVDLLDLGSTDATADLVVKDSNGVILANYTLPATAFGAADEGVATAGTITWVSTVAAGTGATFEARNRDNTVVISGSVGTSGEALNLTSTTFAVGVENSITAFTYTQP